ncbi:hypothetical protein [Kineococcus esterisolvens]|uniref:hypothetical protein n=1 Tax=unclassified Kineococcus TaxID=2621656 RepID=UPI003D7CEFF0
MRRRLVIPLAAALSALLALPACSGSDIDGPVITVTGTFDSTLEAVGATVTLDEGCLRSEDSVLVWSEGTTWDEQNQEVVQPDGTRVPPGAGISLNAHALPDLEEALGEDGARAVEACGGVPTPSGGRPSGGLAVRVA